MRPILHDGDPRRCVVLLPGVRYFSQAPLLWFAREAAQAAGWSVLELSERAPADEEPFDVDARASRSALDATAAGQVAVVGKSLGSAAAPLVAERGLPAVWLTPLLIRPDVVAALDAASAGAADRQPRRPDLGRGCAAGERRGRGRWSSTASTTRCRSRATRWPRSRCCAQVTERIGALPRARSR